MKFTLNFDMDDFRQPAPPVSELKTQAAKDVWRFADIRKTLWGKGPGMKINTDLYDLTSIRKNLWGR